MRTAVGAFSKSAKAGILYKDTLGMLALRSAENGHVAAEFSNARSNSNLARFLGTLRQYVHHLSSTQASGRR